MEQIKLDMIPKGITPIAHASQYDQGRLIHFILMDNLQAFILTDETVTIKVCKPDDNIVTAEATYTANTNIVTISTTDQMCAVAGDAKCELSVSKGDVKIGSLNFILRVEEDPLKDGVESETVIANLDTIIDNAVSEALNDTVLYGAYPTAEIDNVPIASFPDGADDVPVKALQIGIEATQEGTGTPSPDNDRPISGFTGANIKVNGKNFFDKNSLGIINNKYLTSDGTETTSSSFFVTDYFTIKGGYNITISGGGPSGNAPSICFYDKNKTFISGIAHSGHTFPYTYTTPNNAVYARESIANDDKNTIQIELGSTATTYQNFNPNSELIYIDWTTEAGTVYGGYLRIVNGIVNLVATYGFKTYTGARDEIWVEHAVIANCFFIDNSLNNAYLNNAEHNYAITNMFVQKNYNQISSLANGEFCLGLGTGNAQRLACKYTDVATLADWKTWLSSNNLTIKFKLATPVEYTLTGIPPITTLQGTNNIFTDTGDIQNLIYRRDMNSIVEAIPAPPSENGTYSLKCTVSGGVASYSWVAD